MRYSIPKNLFDALITVTGVVLVWRGIWLLVDMIDVWLFAGNHALTGIAGIAIGLLILYRHHHNFDELRKL
jgi:hypothetical protein